MFTTKQRYEILKWGSLTLIALVLLASIMHGLFFLLLFQYYIPLIIIGCAIYYGYTKSKTIQLTDEQIIQLFKTKFSALTKK